VFIGDAWTMQARGKPNGGFQSREVLLLKDGLRLNDSYSEGMSQVTRLMTLEDVKQVEIIRGPGSALYGSNAFLGVINIVTVEDVNEANVSFGSFETKTAALNMSKSGDDWKVSAFAHAFADEGDEMSVNYDLFGNPGANNPQNDIREGYDFGIKFNYKNFSANFNYMKRSFDEYVGGLAIFGTEVNDNFTSQTSIGIGYKKELNDRVSLNFAAGHVSDDTRILWQFGTVGGDGSNELTFGFDLEGSNSNLNLDVNTKLSEKNTLIAGVGFYEQGIDDSATLIRLNNTVTPLRGAGSVTDNETRDISSLFLQDQHRFSDTVNLILGIRYDDYSDFGDTTNPRGALIFSPGEGKSKFKLMYGQAFRAPSNSEQYSKNNPASIGNPDLQPEEVTTIEAAYIQKAGNFQGTVTYFHNDITNLIVLLPIDGGDLQDLNKFFNQGEVETEGLELEFSALLGRGLFLRGSYTHEIDAEDIWSPDKYGSLILNYTNNKWNLNFNTTYHGEIPRLSNPESYFIYNAKVTYKLGDSMDVYLKGFNLGDENARTPDAPGTNAGIEVPRRGAAFYCGAKFKL
jgi:iron complex outermembrane receptor protein